MLSCQPLRTRDSTGVWDESHQHPKCGYEAFENVDLATTSHPPSPWHGYMRLDPLPPASKIILECRERTTCAFVVTMDEDRRKAVFCRIQRKHHWSLVVLRQARCNCVLLLACALVLRLWSFGRALSCTKCDQRDRATNSLDNHRHCIRTLHNYGRSISLLAC